MVDNKQLPHSETLDYFYEICKIPHASRNEQVLSQWVIKILEKFGGEVRVDEYHQIYATFAPSKGYEKLPIVCLQSHLDMVDNKSSNSPHDFSKDPIEVHEDDGFLKANHTTLGADNGIGVAMILAIISNPLIKHGPLECLFTVQEEIGGVEIKNYLKFKYVLNLDNEAYYNIDISGASLVVIKSTFDVKRVQKKINHSFLDVHFTDFSSGHSGNKINEKRANAIKEIFYMLSLLRNEFDFSITNIHNIGTFSAIAYNCNVGIQISEDRTDAFQTKASSIFEDMKHFYSKHEKNMKMTINKSRDVPHKPLDINDSDKIINFICTVSSGMSIYDWDMSVVESSSNIGLISLKNNVLECTQSIRSNNLYGETQLLLKSFALIKLLNGKYEIHNSAKAWSPDKNNRLAKYIIDVAKDKMNETFKLVCKHAGKEVAHVLDAYPNATGVSIGFNIFEAHTPNESVEIKTIDRMYTLLQHLLISIKE